MSWHPSNDPILGDPASCDALVAIPVRGRIESLSVSAAAAVILYAADSRRAG